ncbi:MAG TPA: sigma-54 dependent transcriptional regulator [Myxococcaceae bacterium]
MSRSEPRVLVVDDHVEMARLLGDQLGELGYRVTTATSGGEAVDALRSAPFDVVITDLRMEKTDGFDVLQAALEVDPSLPVLIMTAFGAIDTAIEAIKRGAYHYLTKPFRLEEVRVYVERALQERRVRSEWRSLRQIAGQRSSLASMLGRGAAMQALFQLVERVRHSEAPVLIRGESGTGKELVARALHFEGPRRAGPFVPVNCTALPPTLLESELFGHVRGSFTGASAPRRGLFVEADGGTLFLDEIGDMAPELQSKLLRVLEDGEIRPVGADAPRKVDARIVAATHQDLEAHVREGRFRADLFYRLNVVPIAVPPLRDRLEDLPLLVAHFLEQARQRTPRALLEGFTDDAMRALAVHRWPGNVRELENLVERLVVVSGSARVERAEVEAHLARSLGAAPHPLATAGKELVTLRRLEDDYIAWVVAQCGGNKTRAAEILGIDVSTIHRRDRERERG